MACEWTRWDVLTFYTVSLWTLVILAATFQGGGTEVASSVSVMTSLISQEEKLIEHLSKVLDLAIAKRENGTWISRIKRYLECIEVKHRSVAKASGNLAHPVIGFRLVRRLAKEWNSITSIIDPAHSRTDNVHSLYDNLKGMHDVMSKWTRWPKVQDLTDSAMGLIRIGTTYRLYPSTIQYEYGPHDHTQPVPMHLEHRDDGVTGMSLLSSPEEIKMFYVYNNRINDNYNSALSSNVTECFPHCKNSSGSGRSNLDGDTNDNNVLSNNNVDKRKQNSRFKNSSSINTSKSNTSTSSFDNERSKDASKEQSCYYNYASLDFKDLMFIINVAINQKLKTEAGLWYSLLESGFGRRKDKTDGGRKSMEDVKKKIQSMNDQGPNTEPIMKKYAKLCRDASQVESVSSLPVAPHLYCFWRHSHPYRRYKVELLHTSPDIYQFHDVISPLEMDHIKHMAKEKLVPSALDIGENTKKEARYWRVSQTAWFRDETPVLQRLSERVGHLTGLDTGIVPDTRGQLENVYSEPFQVVNYGLGGLYGPHLDTLHSTSHQPRGSHQRHSGDRLATWMFYLGDVHVGGATVFPRINVSVKPIKGSAILWYNLLRNGQIDKRTVHAGCPVVIGDKWVANKWVRDTAQWKTRPCLLDSSL